MEITNVKIQKTFDEPGKMLVAICSVTIDNLIAIHDIRLLKSSEKTFIAMPNKKLGDSTYKDLVHPINAEGRKMLEDAVISAYNSFIENASNDTETANA